MTLAASFLGGAKSRLLPPSIPVRFFAVAAIFHVLMWLAIEMGDDGRTGRDGIEQPQNRHHWLRRLKPADVDMVSLGACHIRRLLGVGAFMRPLSDAGRPPHLATKLREMPAVRDCLQAMTDISRSAVLDNIIM